MSISNKHIYTKNEFIFSLHFHINFLKSFHLPRPLYPLTCQQIPRWALQWTWKFFHPLDVCSQKWDCCKILSFRFSFLGDCLTGFYRGLTNCHLQRRCQGSLHPTSPPALAIFRHLGNSYSSEMISTWGLNKRFSDDYWCQPFRCLLLLMSVQVSYLCFNHVISLLFSSLRQTFFSLNP